MRNLPSTCSPRTSGCRTPHATDPKRDAAVRFAHKIIEARGWLSDADLNAVRDAGYEIIALVAVYSLTNFFNNVFDPEVDFPAVPPAGSIQTPMILGAR